MKILVDENMDGMDERLKDRGYEAYSVRKLRGEGKKLASDYSVINFALKNDMVIVTKDREFRTASEENDFPIILLDEEGLLELIIQRMKEIHA